MPTPRPEPYAFGPFLLEVDERRLSRDGRIVPLTPKVFDTLVLLVERAGHLVTKGELMAALWGDLVVEEANLTKNIWLLRKALSEETEGPFIETVPKIGYRWVAPLRRPAPAATSPPPPADGASVEETRIAAAPSASAGPPEASPRRFRPGRVASVLAIVLAAAAAALVVYRQSRTDVPSPVPPPVTSPSAPTPRPSVAVLGFSDLSRRGSTAWLSTALSEMVASELAAGERVRLVAAEDVVRQNVAAPAGTLSAETLDRLHKSLHADFVVRGAYASVPAPGGDRLRLDVVVQDARTGESAGSVSATGMENDLFRLVSSVGMELRGKLGLSAATAAEQASVAASLPRSPEASRLYAEGLDRLRRLDAQAARGLLERAALIEPAHPLIHDALSRAWSALGYDAKARSEAERAQALSSGLSREERLVIEARLWESRKEWDRAIEVERTLFGFFPDRLDYGLKLAGAQTAGGRAKDALATIARLAQLPAPDRDDPRIDLAEARAAAALSDHARHLDAATRAVRKAEALGGRGLLARAKNEQTGVLEDLGRTSGADAVARREEVVRLFEADGDVNGAATARIGLGNTFLDAGNLARAAALYGEAQDAFRRVGNQAGLATSFSDLCLVEWLQGRVEEARGHARRVIEIRREIHDRSGTAWALTVLGNFLVEDGKFDEARRLQEEALAISREIGDRAYASFCFGSIGTAYETEGRLDEAEKSFRRALAISEEMKEPGAIAGCHNDLGNLEMDRGDVGAAERDYAKALDLRVKAGDEVDAAETRMQIAQVRFDQRRYAESASLAADAAKAFEKQNQPGNLAISRSILARADASLGRSDEARKEAARARELVATSRQNGAVLPVLLAAARVAAATGDPGSARNLAAEARRRAERIHWRGFVLEARLVEAELELGPSRPPRAVAELAAVARDARSAGFGRTAREAEAAAASAKASWSSAP